MNKLARAGACKALGGWDAARMGLDTTRLVDPAHSMGR